MASRCNSYPYLWLERKTDVYLQFVKVGRGTQEFAELERHAVAKGYAQRAAARRTLILNNEQLINFDIS